MEKGKYFEFISHNGLLCTGYMLTTDEESFTYVRDSLTVWNASLPSLNSAKEITENDYFYRVRLNARGSGEKTGPSDLAIKEALKVYGNNLDANVSEIKEAMEKIK